MVAEKEFGKLSLSQLKQMASLLLDLKPQRTEITRAAIEDNKKFLANAPANFAWSNFYSLSLKELVSTVLWLGQLDDQVSVASEQADPQQYILDTFKTLDPQVRDYCGDIVHAEYTFVASVIALMKALESIEVYGSSLNRLMGHVAVGDDRALIDIVRLDRSAVGHTLVARRIALAELQQEPKFSKQLNNALKHRPKKHTARYAPLRYLLLTLHELGCLENLSTDDLFQLFCIDLKLYPTNGADPARSLKRLVDRWVSSCGTPDGDFMS